jgi:hypothetical protein
VEQFTGSDIEFMQMPPHNIQRIGYKIVGNACAIVPLKIIEKSTR